MNYFTNNDSAVVSSNRILYTPSSFARTSLLYLQEIGELTAQHPHVSKRAGLSSYLFIRVTHGSGIQQYEGKDHALSASDCVFIDCEKPYSHTTDENNLWTLQWVHFYGSSLPAIYKKYCERGGRPVFKPESSNDDELPRVWNHLISTAGSQDYMRDMLINQHLSELLTLIMSESWHPEDQENLPPKKSMIAPVKDYLDQNYSSKITLDDLTARFYINKYYLTKTFKAQYGVSINSYLLSVRITKAKQMLRFTNKTVEEIGLECGLGAPHYFSQTFKSVEGVPPSKYRTQW